MLLIKKQWKGKINLKNSTIATNLTQKTSVRRTRSRNAVVQPTTMTVGLRGRQADIVVDIARRYQMKPVEVVRAALDEIFGTRQTVKSMYEEMQRG